MSPSLKKINLQAKQTIPVQKTKLVFSKRLKKWVAVLTILIFGILLWSNLSSSESVFRFALGRGNPLKSTDGRINILLLGIGGANHDGPDLTDSIIVASYNLKSHGVTLFSIPRDVWLTNINQKINTAYVIGKQQGKGLSFAEDKIDDILGIPIHYGVVIDFSGFSKAIDLVGGVDVNVPNTFDDYEYPIDGKENDLCGLTEKEVDLTPDQAQTLGLGAGKQTVLVDSSGQVATQSANFACRFEHIHFDQGMMHMDGETALKFVRSRHGTGVEGSDFARSKRQQLVLQAFREKLLSAQTLSNPQKIASLIDTFGKSIDTDIPKGNLPDLYAIVKNTTHVNSVVLGDLGGGKSLFINPPVDNYGGAWVLTPPNNDFSQVELFVKNTLAQDELKK